MQIAGNGSSNLQLNWMQDRIGATMPQPWAVSVPLYVYRSLMLLWAMWLAWSLLTWLRWAWQCYGKGGIWKPIDWRRRKATAKTTAGGASGEPASGPSAEATRKPTSAEGC
jgi:hypothetical protein